MRAFLFVILLITFVSFTISHEHRNSNHQHQPSEGIQNFFRVCGADIERFCRTQGKSSTVHNTPAEIFDADCFKQNEEQLVPACKELMVNWRAMQNQIQPLQPLPNPPVDGTKGGEGNEDDGKDKEQEEDDDDKEEDDDDKEEDDDDEDGKSKITAFYTACNADRINLCPETKEFVKASKFFESKCFQEGHHAQGLTTECRKYYENWVKQRAVAFGILISGSFAILFGGLLVCMSLICCVACCIRVRRTRRTRRMQQLNKVKEEIPLTNELNGIPMQSFASAPSTASSPYSAYPQYWQPVLYVAEEGTQQ